MTSNLTPKGVIAPPSAFTLGMRPPSTIPSAIPTPTSASYLDRYPSSTLPYTPTSSTPSSTSTTSSKVFPSTLSKTPTTVRSKAPPAAAKRPTTAPTTTPSSTTSTTTVSSSSSSSSSSHVPSTKPEKRPTLGYNALKKSEENLLHETQRMAEIIGAYDVEITQINQQSAMEQAALREVIQQKEEDISRLQGLMEEQRQDMEKLDRDWQERYQKHDQNLKQELQNTKKTLTSRCEELQTLLAAAIQRSQAQERKLETLGVDSVTLERLEEDEKRKEEEQKDFEEQVTKLSCSLSSANDFMKTAIHDLTSLRDELSLPLSLSA